MSTRDQQSADRRRARLSSWARLAWLAATCELLAMLTSSWSILGTIVAVVLVAGAKLAGVPVALWILLEESE
jgi:hypothetical protein